MNGRLMADRFMSCPFRQADIQVKRPVSLSGLVEPAVNADGDCFRLKDEA
jgi:hypothetical protein